MTTNQCFIMSVEPTFSFCTLFAINDIPKRNALKKRYRNIEQTAVK